MNQISMSNTAWPLLLARLRHLLVTEGYGSVSTRYPGNVPVSAQARTVRHLIAMGPDSAERLAQEWPEVQSLPVWEDLRSVIEQGPRSDPAPPPIASRFEEL